MQVKHIFILSFFWCISTAVYAQHQINTILTSIDENNKTLITGRQQVASQQIGFNTGLYLPNPFMEYDYMKGTPAEAGNQRDFSITQPLDFPTVYAIKKKLAAQQSSQVQTQYAIEKQNLLLEAKLTCLELIYQNKRQYDLSGRMQRLEQLTDDFRKRLAQGDASILDVNKAGLQLINLKHALRENTTAIELLTQKLTELNGGNPVSLPDTLYPPVPVIPAFAQLDSLIEANDPVVQSVELQKQIAQKQVSLTKALLLPKLEAGYHYQAILGQTYQGVHGGLTIPLWENKNTVRFRQAQVLVSELQLQEHRVAHIMANKRLYTQYENLSSSLKEYGQYLSSVQTIALLDKALNLGQISTLDYFLEINYLVTTYERYLQLENEYHQVIARLYKYQL